ncbi:hypothetical protein NTE04_003874 [Vibrio mimicus]
MALDVCLFDTFA